MGSFSIWHWLIVIIVLLVIIVPFWKILPRAGIPAPIAILAIIPLVPLVLLWILAFKRWPQDQ